MSSSKLMIVTVKLNPLQTETSSFRSSPNTATPACVIKTALGEISFFNGVDESIVQTIMKELKSR